MNEDGHKQEQVSLQGEGSWTNLLTLLEVPPAGTSTRCFRHLARPAGGKNGASAPGRAIHLLSLIQGMTGSFL